MYRREISLITIGLSMLFLIAACTTEAQPNPDQPADAGESEQTEEGQDASESVLEPVSLKIGVFHYASFSPLFIAYEEGYFTEQGLDVELVNFGGASSEMIPALASGELDAAGYTLSVAIFNAIAEGIHIKYVADKGFMDPDNCVTDAWVASASVLANGELEDPADLAGKSVVFPPGGSIEYTLDLLLAQNGLTQTDIVANNIADSAARVEGLNTGAVALSVLSEPWISRAQSSGAGDVWIPFSEIIPNQSLGAIIYGPSLLDGDPDVGVRLMRAYLKGVQKFNEGLTDRNVEIIASYTGQDPEEIRSICQTAFKADGLIDAQGLLQFQDWALSKGYVDAALELDQFWTPTFVEAASSDS